MKMNLIKGQEIAILNNAGNDYIAVVNSPQPLFTLWPANQVAQVKIELYTVKENETCAVDLTPFIKDGNDIEYGIITGGRPRNISRR